MESRFHNSYRHITACAGKMCECVNQKTGINMGIYCKPIELIILTCPFTAISSTFQSSPLHFPFDNMKKNTIALNIFATPISAFHTWEYFKKKKRKKHLVARVNRSLRLTWLTVISHCFWHTQIASTHGLDIGRNTSEYKSYLLCIVCRLP